MEKSFSSSFGTVLQTIFCTNVLTYTKYYAVKFLLQIILHFLANSETLRGAMLLLQIAALLVLPTVLSKAAAEDQ